MGSTTSLVQWVKDQHCCSCDIGCSGSLNSVPGLGTSICHKGKKKKKKTTIKYHLTLGRMVIITQMTNAGEGVVKREPSYTVGGNVN